MGRDAAYHTGVGRSSAVPPSTFELGLTIRRAVSEDAPGIVAVLGGVVQERRHSAIDRVWSVEQERSYLACLSPREVTHVAVDRALGIIGVQTLDRWSQMLESMAHVGQVGTFLLPAWRRRGVGRELWKATAAFAREAGYTKLVVQVRGTNLHAQMFYQRLGFTGCGRLSRQVLIDGCEDDEILMEVFLR
jgi:ribosomal protein S18 acetylase RimI-like enzyme